MAQNPTSLRGPTSRAAVRRVAVELSQRPRTDAPRAAHLQTPSSSTSDASASANAPPLLAPSA
jgi:hypothetical protein